MRYTNDFGEVIDAIESHRQVLTSASTPTGYICLSMSYRRCIDGKLLPCYTVTAAIGDKEIAGSITPRELSNNSVTDFAHDRLLEAVELYNKFAARLNK